MRPCPATRRRRSSDAGLLPQRLSSPEPERLNRLSATHHAAFQPASRGWSAEEIARLAQSGALFAEGQDRAFALFSVAADEAELLTIAVHPDHRRKGLARALLGAAKADLRTSGATTVHLEVAADNDAAIALYRKLGFSVSGTRRAYYQRPEGERVDAVMMFVDL